MAYLRSSVRRQIRDQPSRAQSVLEAVSTLWDAAERPEMYTGELKREQPLVQDVVEGVRGLGELTAPEIYAQTGIGRRRPLVDLGAEDRERLSQAIAGTLGIRARRQLAQLLADDGSAEDELLAE